MVKAKEKFLVSTLCDMSNFYDRIDLQKLADRWELAQYPPTHTMLAMQLYTGYKMMEAEGIVSPIFRSKRGILAGDPQAPQVAKIYLMPVMQRFQEKFPDVHLDLWIDDVSFDVTARTPESAAKKTLEAYRFLKGLLEADGLLLSTKKTGYIVSDKKIKAAMKPLLQEGDAEVVDTMRDLGCDSSGGRMRRVKVLKSRMQRGMIKNKKLRSLKIKKGTVKIRLYKGSIQASTLWGVEATGLAPAYRKSSQLAMGRAMGLQMRGSVDVVFDQNQKHQDPADTAVEKQLRAYHKLYHSWEDKEMLHHAWHCTRERLLQAKHQWRKVAGPMAAMQAYLMEAGWKIEDPEEWWKEETDFLEAQAISIHWPWEKIQSYLREEFQRQRIRRLQKKTHCEKMVPATLDWTMSKNLAKNFSKKDATALQTWHQGSLRTHDQEGRALCPYCNVKVTTIHLIWECRRTCVLAGPIEDDWADSIGSHKEPELWAYGFLSTVATKKLAGKESIKTWGTWQRGEAIQIPKQDWIHVAIQKTSKDKRILRYVVALVHYNEQGRQGAVTCVLPGTQSESRAWFLGLILTSVYTMHERKVLIPNVKAFEAWKEGKHHDTFWDLKQEWDQSNSRVQALYTSKKQLKKNKEQMQAWEKRAKDAQKVVDEEMNHHREPEVEEYLHNRDRRVEPIYRAAVQRIRALLEDKEHFMHKKAKETGKVKRQQGRLKKRELLQKLPQADEAGGHRWQEQKGIMKCRACNRVANMHTAYKQLQQLYEEECTEAGDERPEVRGGKQETRDVQIQRLLQDQEGRQEGHQWQVKGEYIRCEKCGAYAMKRCKGVDFDKLVQSECINREYEPPAGWKGHSSHSLWQKGNQVTCKSCQSKARKNEGVFEATEKLKKACSSGTNGQQRLDALFQRK